MSGSKFLKNKRVLITSFSYALFGGAEQNAVELAVQLREYGAIVTFFSYDIDGPLKNHIESQFRTRVLTDEIYYLAEDDTPEQLKNTQLSIEDYDYIWVGGNTIPLSILKQVSKTKILPKFIFVHMSSLLAFPLDAPLLLDFEKKAASRILSIGNETTIRSIHRVLGTDTDVYIWSNPVPKEYKLTSDRQGKLKKAAIISSSHPSEEMLEAKKILENMDIEIDCIGAFNDNVQIVDARLYDNYDLIIGIGKNAKYSLVSGVPIYVYGRFGGPGYLSGEIIDNADETNFSGRGFGKKTPKEIAKEVTRDYKKALEYHRSKRNEFIKKYSIDIVTRDLFTQMEKEYPKKVSFSEEYINWLISMQINIMQRHYATKTVRAQNERIGHLEAELKAISIELNKVYVSRSWYVTRPLRLIAKLFKRQAPHI